MDMIGTHTVLSLATRGVPMEEIDNILARSIGLVERGELVRAGLGQVELEYDCLWLQGFFRLVAEALLFLQERDTARMTCRAAKCINGASMHIYVDRHDSNLSRLSDFVDDLFGDLALDLRNTMSRRPALAYQAEDYYFRLNQYLMDRGVPSTFKKTYARIADNGMQFHVVL